MASEFMQCTASVCPTESFICVNDARVAWQATRRVPAGRGRSELRTAERSPGGPERSRADVKEKRHGFLSDFQGFFMGCRDLDGFRRDRRSREVPARESPGKERRDDAPVNSHAYFVDAYNRRRQERAKELQRKESGQSGRPPEPRGAQELNATQLDGDLRPDRRREEPREEPRKAHFPSKKLDMQELQ